ncbi:hypothetical protein LIER_09847 [Lithospermum erythrorhizon]|uniref:Uncharacterized protein n=1 Tax=Lithospermum erythrorhizon TaxID=34254 RepID=A0AAV3PIH5_LITER
MVPSSLHHGSGSSSNSNHSRGNSKGSSSTGLDDLLLLDIDASEFCLRSFEGFLCGYSPSRRSLPYPSSPHPTASKCSIVFIIRAVDGASSTNGPPVVALKILGEVAKGQDARSADLDGYSGTRSENAIPAVCGSVLHCFLPCELCSDEVVAMEKDSKGDVENVKATVASSIRAKKRQNFPYLCKKDGITLHCPKVNEKSSMGKSLL